MQEIEVQELFARLTSRFEDAAALAAEGQRAGLAPEAAVRLLTEIRANIDDCMRGMAEIERTLKS